MRVLVCAVALAPLAAAADGHVGAWVTQVQGQRYMLMLNADGTFSIAGNPGTYRVMGNVMESTSAGGTVRYHMQLSGDRMVLSGGDLQQPMVLTRVRAAAPTPTPTTSTPGLPPFDTFQTQGASFGYPKGWQVTPIQGGYYITEQGPNAVGPGVVLMAGQALPGMTTAQAATSLVFQALQQTMPNLAIAGQDMHPQLSRILRTKLTYGQGAMQYDATSYTDVAQGKFVFAMFFSPQARTSQLDANAMLMAVIKPMYGLGKQQTPATPPPARPQPQPPAAGQAEITDQWFLPAGRTLRGFYGGTVFRDTLRSHMTTSAVPVEGVPHSQSSSAQTGGDFRVALYTDGTVRAKLVVANWGPMVSYNVPLRYVGTYQLAPSGQFRTSELTITGSPSTYRKFEQLMAKMKMAGQYVQQQDTLNVHLETFNVQQNRWWSKGQKALTRATRRRTYVFGAQGTQDGTNYVGGKGR